MKPTTGTSPATTARRGMSLQDALSAQVVQGSERFAGCGDFDARPPNFLGYDVNTPRYRRASVFVPGRVVPLEG